MMTAMNHGALHAPERNGIARPGDGAITIERWMVEELALKGTSAIIYAAIWQSGPGGLTASVSALAHRAGVSAKSAKRCLAALKSARLVEEPRPGAAPSDPRTWTASIWSDPLE